MKWLRKLFESEGTREAERFMVAPAVRLESVSVKHLVDGPSYYLDRARTASRKFGV